MLHFYLKNLIFPSRAIKLRCKFGNVLYLYFLTIFYGEDFSTGAALTNKPSTNITTGSSPPAFLKPPEA